MDLKGKRQSSNVQTSQEVGYENVDSRAMNSKVLRSKMPLVDQPAEKGTRVGILEPSMDTSDDWKKGDYPFFKHTIKDCM